VRCPKEELEDREKEEEREEEEEEEEKLSMDARPLGR